MIRSRIIHYFLCLALLLAAAGGLVGTQAVFAQEEPEPVETLELETKFPVLSGESGETYEFEVDVKYQGAERKRFDLTISVPPDWVERAFSGYPEKQIAAVELGPSEGFAITDSIMDGMLDEYYESRGWTEDGIPGHEKLKELELENFME